MPLHQHLPKGLLSGMFLLFSFFAYSQTRTITGRITDDKGNPLPGATITVRGSTTTVSADSVGQFHINDQTVNGGPCAPFGGRGKSGNGTRVGGPADIEEFTQWQWVSVNKTATPYPF